MKKAAFTLLIMAFGLTDLTLAQESTPSTEPEKTCESTVPNAATPFQLAYDYRFVACRRPGTNLSRAQWILESAAAEGKVSCDQLENESLRYDVARFLRGYCRNRA